jgi:hypothetical protein
MSNPISVSGGQRTDAESQEGGLSEASNAASCRVAEQVGFEFVGEGERLSKFGLSVLGAYRLKEPVVDDLSKNAKKASSGLKCDSSLERQ